MGQSCEDRKGQSVLEYALLITTAIVVIIGTQIYFKRALQGRWKDASDQVGEQFTTARTFTMETRQQSSREEATGTSGEIAAKNWSRSAVLNTLPKVGSEPRIAIADVGGKEALYTGHETTRKDYVAQAIKAGTIGTHDAFDSGQFSKIKLFDDQ